MVIFAVCHCEEESNFVNHKWYWDVLWDEVIGYFQHLDDALRVMEDVEKSYEDVSLVEIADEEKIVYVSSDMRYRYYIKRITVN